MATTVEAPMVGKILKIEKNVGDHVDEDDVVIVMEAMKMEIPIVAPASGTLKEVKVDSRSSRRSRTRARGHRVSPQSRNALAFSIINWENPMDTWTFGWTLALIGMGGTMLVLWLLSLLILLIKKIFPYQPDPIGS